MIDWLERKRRNEYSQFGEDGIIEAIFERIGTTNKWCLEVGATDGKAYSNTRRLYEQDWTCVLIESDTGNFEKLKENAPKARCVNSKIENSGPNSLDAILSLEGAPKRLDFLSLDIDGNEYEIWQELKKYKPRVVCIEHAYHTKKTLGQASAEQMAELAERKGYFVAAKTECNSICVLKEEWYEGDEKPVKLNLGAGVTAIPGYTAIDRKQGSEAYPLGYADGTIDIIRASHVLEHFSWRQIYEVVLHWTKKLKSGGVLKIAVPNGQELVKELAGGNRAVIPYLFGGHTDDDDKHGAYIDANVLGAALDQAGLVNLRYWESEIDDAAALPISLNLAGTKPPHWEERLLNISRAKAVISQPRLGFLDNRLCIERAIYPLGIDFATGTGVFWGQILERMLERHIEDGTEFILTLDWDSWFTQGHIRRLYSLIRDNPEIDAICPVQTTREGVLPLAGCDGPEGQEEVTIDICGQLTPITSGHFGLTLIRVSALKRMKHPWFWSQPDSTGRWGKGRTDDDIYFWRNFRSSGNKLVLANRINIGHLQLMCTFPGRIEDNWKPIHMYLKDLDKNGPPAHCIPQIPILKGD